MTNNRKATIVIAIIICLIPLCIIYPKSIGVVAGWIVILLLSSVLLILIHQWIKTLFDIIDDTRNLK